MLQVTQEAVEGFENSMPWAKEKLARILQIMLYAHTASKLRDSAKEMLATLL